MGCQQLYLAVDGNWSLAALGLPCLFGTGFGPAGMTNAKRFDHSTSDAGCAFGEAQTSKCARLNTAG